MVGNVDEGTVRISDQANWSSPRCEGRTRHTCERPGCLINGEGRDSVRGREHAQTGIRHVEKSARYIGDHANWERSAREWRSRNGRERARHKIKVKHRDVTATVIGNEH